MANKKQSTSFGFRCPTVIFDEFPLPQYDPPEYDSFIQGQRLFVVRPPQFMTNLLPEFGVKNRNKREYDADNITKRIQNRMKKIHEEFMKDMRDPHYSFNSILRRRLK